MGNIIDYIRENQCTFEEHPFTPVDSLILSTISYFDFGTITFADLQGAKRVRLHDILALSDCASLTQGNWLRDSKDTKSFWAALMASRRYREVELGFYVNEISNIIEKQFSAVCFFLPNSTLYVAFRGTDGSFAGWKEDFNIFFKQVVPSQVSAARYISGVASAVSLPLILGGHSKGGHLAEYAALVADESVFDRVIAVFNHDGPSFLENPSPRIDTPIYNKKLNKTVPESSLFGMILEERNDYQVVQSTANLVFQHEPFTWVVNDNDFQYQSKLSKNSVLFDNSIDAWLKDKTPEERELFVDTIYELFSSGEAKDWHDFNEKLPGNIKSVIKKSAQLDSETKKFIFRTLSAFGSSVKDEAIKRILFELPDSLQRKRGDRSIER